MTTLLRINEDFRGTGRVICPHGYTGTADTTGGAIVEGDLRGKIDTTGPVVVRGNCYGKISNTGGGVVVGDFLGEWATTGEVWIGGENKGKLQCSGISESAAALVFARMKAEDRADSYPRHTPQQRTQTKPTIALDDGFKVFLVAMAICWSLAFILIAASVLGAVVR